MIKIRVLGISGWKDLHKYFTRTNILPLHDAAAALIIDGNIIALAEEERFTRQKYGYDCFPTNSTLYCLAEAGLNLQDIDKIAVYWDMPFSAQLKGKRWNISQQQLSDRIFPPKIFGNPRKPKLEFVNHHYSHALSAYCCSEFDDALVLVIDGQGEISSTTLWKTKDKKLIKLREMDSSVSLGYFYESLTEYIGLEPNEPGKTMGLAAYGTPTIPFDEFFKIDDGIIMLKNPASIDMKKDFDEQQQIRGYWFKEFSRYLKGPNKIVSEFRSKDCKIKKNITLSQEYINLAASGQRTLEEVVLRLVDWGIKETGIHNVCIAGGVGLNCVMNGKILQHKLVDNLFIQPIAHDAGAAMGAAIACSELTDKVKFFNAYLGPEFSKDNIKEDLDKSKINYKYYDRIEEKVAELLCDGYLIGWFQGRMEAGSRALGNRSILANPTIKNINDVLNNNVKFRENWRPFAPSILEEYKDEFLENAADSPYMILSFTVPENSRSKIPGVVHVDGSVRPQTVSKKTNQRYWNLINEFYKLTGVPVLLNTSFNVKGEPIVCTPKDAIKTFFSCGLDYLTIGNYLIKKGDF